MSQPQMKAKGALDPPASSADSRLPAVAAPIDAVVAPHNERSPMLKVGVVAKSGTTWFVVSRSIIEEREVEMKKAREAFGIPEDRWAGSLLYRKIMAEDEAIESLTLYPEQECIDKNYSHSFAWTPWLTTLLENFYQTGKLKVPAACQGYDLLLALEYFGILYQPGQLIFDSYAAYARVKHWSDYLTHRAPLADQVAEFILQKSQSDYLFATVGEGEANGHALLDLGDQEVNPLTEDAEQAAVVSGFFHVTQTTETSNPEDALQMREDFAMYLQNLLTDVHVTFTIQTVTLTDDNGNERPDSRPVLKVQVVDESSEATPEEAVAPAPKTPETKKKSSDIVFLQEPKQESKGSPRHVADVNHVYEDLAKEYLDPVHQEHEPVVLYAETKSKVSERSDDEIANEEKKEEEMPDGAGDKEADACQPLATYRFDDTAFQKAIGEEEEEEEVAPVTLIKADKADQSVTSALTGPLFVDENGLLRELPDTQDPPTNEWTANALLQSTATRLEALLKPKEKSKKASIPRGPSGNAHTNEGPDPSKDAWDWVTGLYICNYTNSILQTHLSETMEKGCHHPTSTEEVKKAAEQTMYATADFMEKGVEKGKQLVRYCEAPDEFIEEEEAKKRAASGVPQQQPLPPPAKVKDRLAMYQKALEVQSRQERNQHSGSREGNSNPAQSAQHVPTSEKRMSNSTASSTMSVGARHGNKMNSKVAHADDKKGSRLKGISGLFRRKSKPVAV